MRDHEWISKFMTMVDTSGVSEYVKRSHAVAFMDSGHTPKKAFTMIHLLMEDPPNGQVVAIYPVASRERFTRLQRLCGYSERLACSQDLKDNPNHIVSKKKRVKAVDSGDLFEDDKSKSRADCQTSIFGD